MMPRLTDTMHEGIISFWYCHEGDTITQGDPFFIVETDKASVDVEASASGTVLKILATEGEVVPVGSKLAIIGELGENIEKLLVTTSGSLKEKDQKPESDKKNIKSKRPTASPSAKKLAKSKNIDLNQITGTGENGMITREDIEAYLKQKEETSPEAIHCGDDERIVLKGIPKAMAEKMALSAEIPQVTTFAEVDVTQLKKLSKQSGITITSFVIWAVTHGLKLYPIINASLDGDAVIVKKQYNIGVSIATTNGLVVPNIKDAGRKDLHAIIESLNELVKRGRDNRLTIDDISGGTFTITNSGVFGSLFFTPRINPPESAILGMGKIMEQPVLIDNQITVRSMMYLGLSYDHRVIDGENAVKFLQEVKKALEEPGRAFSNGNLN